MATRKFVRLDFYELYLVAQTSGSHERRSQLSGGYSEVDPSTIEGPVRLVDTADRFRTVGVGVTDKRTGSLLGFVHR